MSNLKRISSLKTHFSILQSHTFFQTIFHKIYWDQLQKMLFSNVNILHSFGRNFRFRNFRKFCCGGKQTYRTVKPLLKFNICTFYNLCLMFTATIKQLYFNSFEVVLSKIYNVFGDKATQSTEMFKLLWELWP